MALGIDAQKLLDGAAAMKKALLAAPAGEDLASTLAWETFDGMKKGRNITVFWAYGDRLRQMGEWFAQLWGESIGKDGIGMTPQCALGSIDQHSQLQLYACGPADKFFFFLSTKPGNRAPLSVPNEKLFDEAKEQYAKARRLYSSYADTNQELQLQSFRGKLEDLENEMQLKYNIYTQVTEQLQLARAKVQERTPAFTVVQSATVPVKHSNTPKVFILAVFILIGIAIHLCVLTYRNRNTIFTRNQP